jgi:hypothetical protein
MSMAGPMGSAVGGPGSGHHRSYSRRRWQAPWGVLPVGLTAATTKAEEDVNGGPLGFLLVGPVAATTVVE